MKSLLLVFFLGLLAAQAKYFKHTGEFKIEPVTDDELFAVETLQQVGQGIGSMVQSTGQGIGYVVQSTGQGIGYAVQSTGQGIGYVVNSTGQGIGYVVNSTGQGISYVVQGTQHAVIQGINNTQHVIAFGVGVTQKVVGKTVEVTRKVVIKGVEVTVLLVHKSYEELAKAAAQGYSRAEMAVKNTIVTALAFEEAVDAWKSVNFQTGENLMFAIQVTSRDCRNFYVALNTLTGGKLNDIALRYAEGLAVTVFPPAAIAIETGKVVYRISGQIHDITELVHDINIHVRTHDWPHLAIDAFKLFKIIYDDLK